MIRAKLKRSQVQPVGFPFFVYAFVAPLFTLAEFYFSFFAILCSPDSPPDRQC